MHIRQPAVSGQFYPGTEKDLRKSVEAFIVPVENKIKAKGIVSPHAGYMYSGAVAGMVFSNIEIPQTVIILGPNHTGVGAQYAIITQGSWKLPMGDVGIAEDLAKNILNLSKNLEEDTGAHQYEHSLEVQVPFLQYFQPDVKIIPIAIGGYGLNEFREIGESIAKCVKDYKKDVLIVASSDMTHYEPRETAKRKDDLALEAVLNLDETELIKRVDKHNITMCGFAPTAIMLTAAKALDAKQAKLIQYMTSGDTTGDYSSVVGYAGVVIY